MMLLLALVAAQAPISPSGPSSPSAQAGPSSPSAQAGPALLDKLAADADGRAETLKALSFTATTTTLDLDDAGRAQHSAVKVERVVRGKSTTVSCTVDKVAVVDRADMQACSLPGMSLQIDSAPGGEPFGTHERGSWQMHVDDATHIHLAQVGTQDPAMAGTATLDGKGALAALDLAPARLPALVDVMSLRMRYRDVAIAGGAMGRMLDTLSFELHGGALFVKKAVRTTTHYSEYAAAAE
ncbi:MAG TPA: hypothetical protein VGO62_03025 [Myxococcota bacterium]|jgi:hypothetical protein